MIPGNVSLLQGRDWDIPSYNGGVEAQPVSHGWQRLYLHDFDAMTWGRWAYWLEALARQGVPTDPIPQIRFENEPHPTALKMLENCVSVLTSRGYPRWNAIDYLMDWVLYALGDRGAELPSASGLRGFDPHPYLYQLFVLPMLQLWPYDYWGYLLSDMGHGKKTTAFFPTPLALTDLM